MVILCVAVMVWFSISVLCIDVHRCSATPRCTWSAQRHNATQWCVRWPATAVQPSACAPSLISVPSPHSDCESLDSRSTNNWCRSNCYDDNDQLVAACDPASGAAQVCRCPVDCVIDQWGSWSGCSATCGTGFKTRTRAITTAAAEGGELCPVTSESRICNAGTCGMFVVLGRAHLVKGAVGWGRIVLVCFRGSGMVSFIAMGTLVRWVLIPWGLIHNHQLHGNEDSAAHNVMP